MQYPLLNTRGSSGNAVLVFNHNTNSVTLPTARREPDAADLGENRNCLITNDATYTQGCNYHYYCYSAATPPCQKS